MEILTATIQDCDATIALWQTCGLTRPWNDPVADFSRALGGPASTILLARVGDDLAGSVMVGFDGHRGWVYYVAVDPARRRQTVGAALMQAAEDWLRARGCPKIELMVRTDNATANRFYAALAYKPQAVTVLGKWLGDARGP